MLNNQVGNLFQLQTELIDMKVDMAVGKANDRVLERIADLKGVMTQRLIAVETKLGMVNETEKEIKKRFFEAQSKVQANFIDYSFKAGWLLLASITTYAIVYFHLFSK